MSLFDDSDDMAHRARVARAIDLSYTTNRPQRVYADGIYRDGHMVPDTVGAVVHPEDFMYDPLSRRGYE